MATWSLLMCLVLAAALLGEGQAEQGDGNRIVGGSEAEAHSWPWQGSLQYRGSHICGCTLINENYCLTAAHCVYRMNPGQLSVVLGEHNLNRRDVTEVTVNVARIIMHEHYDPNGAGFPNDIALLKFPDPVTFSQKIKPVALATPGMDFVGNNNCWITGWGLTQGSHSGGPLSCYVNGRWVVAGATSWGISGCQTTGYPSVYTRVSYFYDWIRQNM
uniref:Peptidase S1 domain-containing protein n=1 Tax=Branchiostoma floridae TaxID=7739 RepID=C3YXH2_BRAFL|eukprot:XP_002598769.1 hypothetical protein BRAFLDRAFT_74552 [Branchiostoma floridae]